MARQRAVASDRREAAPRVTGFREATLQGPKTPQQLIVIRDVSVHGLGARARSKAPAFGETVVVTIETLGEIQAMVKWVSRDLFGLHFSAALSKSQLETLQEMWGLVRTWADEQPARRAASVR